MISTATADCARCQLLCGHPVELSAPGAILGGCLSFFFFSLVAPQPRLKLQVSYFFPFARARLALWAIGNQNAARRPSICNPAAAVLHCGQSPIQSEWREWREWRAREWRVWREWREWSRVESSGGSGGSVESQCLCSKFNGTNSEPRRPRISRDRGTAGLSTCAAF